MCRQMSNKEIVEKVMSVTRCKTKTRLVDYLNDKYNVNLHKSAISQFINYKKRNEKKPTITTLMLLEILEIIEEK